MQRHIDNGFKDFEGLSISGQIPVKDQVLNEILADALRGAQTASPRAASAAPPPDFRALLKLVKKAEIRAVNGALVVDFQIGV